MISKPFHLAIEGGDLSKTVPFYTEVLCCDLGKDAEEGRYQDIDFFGNELTLHTTTPRTEHECHWHDVDMGEVLVPHFGIHLSSRVWSMELERVQKICPEFIVGEPFVRYEGKKTEQKTFFVFDPNYNLIELKYYR